MKDELYKYWNPKQVVPSSPTSKLKEVQKKQLELPKPKEDIKVHNEPQHIPSPLFFAY